MIERTPCQRQRGLTLLEVLVASAILGILLAALYGVFSSTLASQHLAENRAQRSRVARIVLLRIGEELQASFPLTAHDAYFVGETRRGESFPDASLSFVSAIPSVLHPPDFESDLRQISYHLVPDPRTPSLRHLVRRVNLDVTTQQETTGAGYPLLSQVRGLRLRFFDGRDWQEQWGQDETRSRLPQAVEMVLYLGDSRGDVVQFSTVVALPLAEPQGGRGS